MKAVLFSDVASSLKWESEDRLTQRSHNNKMMLRRQWRPGCPEPSLWPLAGLLNSRGLEEFPLPLKSSTHAHTESNAGGKIWDVKKFGCSFTCQYRCASDFIDNSKSNASYMLVIVSVLALAHPVVFGLKVTLLFNFCSSVVVFTYQCR